MKLFQAEVCGHVEPADATLGGAAPAIDVPSLWYKSSAEERNIKALSPDDLRNLSSTQNSVWDHTR